MRAWQGGVEKADREIKAWSSKSYPAADAAAQLPGHTAVGAQFPGRVIARGDRGTWMTTTAAGMLATVVCPDQPDDAAQEMRAARDFADQHEFTYGRRPDLREARMAVGRRSDGVVISGTSEQVGQVFAAAGLPFGITSQVEVLPPPGDSVVQRG